MIRQEYIRAHRTPGTSSILSVPGIRGSSFLTFLHADHASWPELDAGVTAAAQRGHSHNVYHVILYTGGSNTMIHDGRISDFTRGSLILTDPGVIHEYRPQSAGGGSFIEISFDLRYGETALSDPWDEVLTSWFGIHVPRREWPVVIPPPHIERMEAAMGGVVSALAEGGIYAESSASVALAGFLLDLVRFLDEEDGRPNGREPDGLERARMIMENRFASPLTVSELATEACMSEGAFIRSFSSRFGSPPMTYRKRLRITAAQHLLTVSGRPVGEIASSVGYGDIYVFSRTFKAVTGMTPTDWRRSRGESKTSRE